MNMRNKIDHIELSGHGSGPLEAEPGHSVVTVAPALFLPQIFSKYFLGYFRRQISRYSLDLFGKCDIKYLPKYYR